jgi:beta-glucosidase
VQIYARLLKRRESQAIRSLAGFRRIHLRKGETSIVEIEIPKERLRIWDAREKDYVVEPGDYEIEAGASSEDIRARKTMTIAQ